MKQERLDNRFSNVSCETCNYDCKNKYNPIDKLIYVSCETKSYL